VRCRTTTPLTTARIANPITTRRRAGENGPGSAVRLLGFALGSLLLGLPFTAITLFALQEARRLRPHSASAFIGVLTAAWGLGQIAGPPLVALLLHRSASAAHGFALSLQAAASALLLGVVVFGWLVRRHPLVRSAAPAAAPLRKSS
jgi:MFS family permease